MMSVVAAAVTKQTSKIHVASNHLRMTKFMTGRIMVPESVTRSSLSIRTHMNHGGSFMGSPPPRHGPRQALQLGLDVTKASQNVLRLLESSHGIHNYSAHYQDTSSPCWHNSCGLRWSFDANSRDNGQWVARPPYDAAFNSPSAALDWIPTISWVQFSDDRTALAKLQAMDGSYRYISLLRLDTTTNHHHPSPSSLMQANDGWVIVREVACPIGSTHQSSSSSDMISLIQCLQDYLNIEHGGGMDDYMKAKQELFAPQASLLTVGMAPSDQMPTPWSAPVGTLLEIPLDTYLEGVKTQTPHPPSSRYQDAIVQIDMTTTRTISGTGGEEVAAAAATVKVGNGARTLVFVDHLLLGKQGKSGWKILSKTFSPQLWEEDDFDQEIIAGTIDSGESQHHEHSHDHGHCHHHDHGSK